MPGPIPPFKRLLDGYKEDPSTSCWVWQGSQHSNGYGWIKVFGKVVSAHKYSYELHKGPIPNGLKIMHSCDNKLCVNPDHLVPGTHQQNMKDAAKNGLMRSGERHHMHGKKNPRPSQANRVLVLGKEYESQKSAERALGLGQGTVRYWIKTGNGKARVLNNGEQK